MQTKITKNLTSQFGHNLQQKLKIPLASPEQNNCIHTIDVSRLKCQRFHGSSYIMSKHAHTRTHTHMCSYTYYFIYACMYVCNLFVTYISAYIFTFAA